MAPTHYDGFFPAAVAVIDSHLTGVTPFACSSACLLAPINSLKWGVHYRDWSSKLFFNHKHNRSSIPLGVMRNKNNNDKNNESAGYVHSSLMTSFYPFCFDFKCGLRMD